MIKKQSQALNDDSTIVLINQCLHKAQRKDIDKACIRRLQLELSRSLQRISDFEKANKLLNQLVLDSEREEDWEVYVFSQLGLALLFEFYTSWELVEHHLNLARQKIEDHKLESNALMANLGIRYSSYLRLTGDLESAQYYAEQALRYSEDISFFKAQAYMLQGFLSEDKFTRLNYLEKAGNLMLELGNYLEYSFMILNITTIYLDVNDYEKFKDYVDKLEREIRNIKGRQNVKVINSLNGLYYQLLVKLYARKMEMDSVLKYSALEKEASLNVKDFMVKDSLADIQLKSELLLSDKKAREQALLLENKQIKENLLVAGFGLFTIGFVFFYRNTIKINKANALIRQQAKELEISNLALEENLKYQKDLHEELHHRVKNNLQLLISLFDLHALSEANPKMITRIEALKNRIYNIAAIHELINDSDSPYKLSIQTYLDEIGKHYKKLIDFDFSLSVSSNLDKLPLSIDRIVPIGILVNELFSNSINHYSGLDRLFIQLDLSEEDGRIHFVFRDNGKGYVSPQDKNEDFSGVGTYLIKSMCKQLKGKYQYDSDNGAVFRLSFNSRGITKYQLH
ncbi:MAG: sensor histidine kinase [Saprospiraceae bacterium]|nr:sensor histidine kinase [Saprospiraceae bacterium]